jgi:hypothetical protein
MKKRCCPKDPDPPKAGRKKRKTTQLRGKTIEKIPGLYKEPGVLPLLPNCRPAAKQGFRKKANDLKKLSMDPYNDVNGYKTNCSGSGCH